ncbi:MAG: sulfotransferase family 2 domain-containing protein [Alteromonadaceae bacterium]|nr:sulfotransferase family 2 domain-containing protein [Alteromonadaceae bacterium]
MSLRQSLRDITPEPLRRGQTAMRRAPKYKQAGIIFIHVPKNAGSSINAALYGQFMGHIRARDFALWTPLMMRSLPSFALTRNPWDRCVSAYRFAVKGAGTGSSVTAKIAHPERYRVPAFESFSRFVNEWLAVKPFSEMDQVFRPQAEFVNDRSGRQLVSFLGKTEEMGAVEAYLQQTLGRDIQIGRTNVSSEKQTDYRAFYSDADAELVGRLYAEDAKLYGYEF